MNIQVQLTTSKHLVPWVGFICAVMVLASAAANAQNVAPLQLQIVDANGNGITGVEIEIGSLVFANKTGLSLALKGLKTLDDGPLQVVAWG